MLNVFSVKRNDLIILLAIIDNHANIDKKETNYKVHCIKHSKYSY